jgi:alkylhydroperoxidase family enzyme
MYLDAVQAHEPGEEAGRFGRVVREGRASGRAIPEIYHLFAFRPRAAEHLAHFSEEVMRGSSPLSPGLCELIAAWTSARNHCVF